jgi:hypothetical protein
MMMLHYCCRIEEWMTCVKTHGTIGTRKFAMGCSFLHQTALGNLTELQAMMQMQPSLINFRDYDRRTALVSARAQEVLVEIISLLSEHLFFTDLLLTYHLAYVRM